MRETKRQKRGGARTRRRRGESRQELPLHISGGGLKNNYDGGEDEGGRCS